MIIVAICKITYFPYLIPDYITEKAPTKAHVGKMWGKCGENVGKMWGKIRQAKKAK